MGLSHEAYESFSGIDLPSPVKRMLPEYKGNENNTLGRLYGHLWGVDIDWLQTPEWLDMEAIDRAFMVAEARVLMPNPQYWSSLDFEFAKSIQHYNKLPPIHNADLVLTGYESAEEKIQEFCLLWEQLVNAR